MVDIHDFLNGGRQPQIGHQSDHERYLTEKYAKKPVIVMNYPEGHQGVLHA